MGNCKSLIAFFLFFCYNMKNLEGDSMVDEKKERSFQTLQNEVRELIFLSNRRNAFREAKDLIRGEVCLSLRDVIILYQAYLGDCFKEFHEVKGELEKKLSSELSYPVRLSLSLVRDEWRQDIKTPKNMKKYWYKRKHHRCCRETVSMNLFFNHQDQLLLQEVYFSHEHDSYKKNKNLDCFYDIYPKYKKDLKKLMRLYHKAVSSLTFFGNIQASKTEHSHAELFFLPYYHYEKRDVPVDPDITGEWTHYLHYYSEEHPINLIINKFESFHFKPRSYCGGIFISLDFDYHLQKALLCNNSDFWATGISSLISNDSDGRVIPEIEFLIAEAFPNFKIYLKDLPDFFSDYLEKYTGTDYLIRGKKKFDKVKEKERINELKVVDKTRQLVANNNLKIVRLIKSNQKLYEKLGERQLITKDILCKMVEDEESGHWIIRPEFREDLEFYDLSSISFDNVDVREIDFRNTNINPSRFNPQTVYHKDLSGCFFESSIVSIYGALFDYSTDFTDVNLSGTTIKQPLTLYNNTISGAIINQYTVLPEELWRIRNKDLTKKNIKS